MSRALRLERHRRVLHGPAGFLLGVALCTFFVSDITPRAHAAVSQTTRLYACVGTNGSVTTRAYAPECKRGQVVSWAVRGEP